MTARPAPITVRTLAGLLFIAFAGFWAGSAGNPLFDLDEGAFSEATLEMLHSGNYLTTTLDNEPRYDKPMFSYWMQGLSVSALGEHEYAFRLPSMLAASVWMLLVFGFVRRRSSDPRAPWLAAGSLAFSLMPGIVGHAATADAILNVLIAATLLDIYRYFESGSRLVMLRVYLWMGLGVLTKGPVAIVVPLAASLAFTVWQRRWSDWLRAIFAPLGWLVLLAVVLPWGVASWLSDGGDWIRHFLFDQNLGRYTNTMQGHGGTPFYYIVALPLIVLPFTALLPGALRRGATGDALDRFCLSWLLVVMAIFSFSSTQLPHYLLYGATPVFILFGRHCGQMPRAIWRLLPALLLLAVFAALPWILPEVRIRPHRLWEAGIVREAMTAFDWHYTLACAAGLAATLYAFRLEAVRGLLVAGAAVSLTLWYGLMPVFAAAQQAPTREAARYARAHDLPVVVWATYLPTFSVYRGAPTEHRLPKAGEAVFIRADKLPGLRDALPGLSLTPLYQRGGIALMQVGVGTSPKGVDSGAATGATSDPAGR